MTYAIKKMSPYTQHLDRRICRNMMYSYHIFTCEQITAIEGLSLSSLDAHKEGLDRDKSLEGQGDELERGFSPEGQGDEFDRDISLDGQGEWLDRTESITGHDEGLGRSESLPPLLFTLQLRSFSGVTGDLRLPLNFACDSAAVRPPWYISIVVRRRRDSLTLFFATELRGDAGWLVMSALLVFEEPIIM